MNQKMNRAAVAALVAQSKRHTWMNLRDPGVLSWVRRKVDKALHRADEMLQEQLNDEKVSPLGMLDDMRPIFRGEYSRCYPDSVGDTTANRDTPQAVCVNQMDARWVVSAGGAPVQQEIIDRTAIIKRMKQMRENPPMADIKAALRQMDACRVVGQRVGEIRA